MFSGGLNDVDMIEKIRIGIAMNNVLSKNKNRPCFYGLGEILER